MYLVPMTDSALPDIAAMVNQGLSGFDARMGFQFLRATTEEVVLEYTVDERHRQPYGIVHGGVHCGVVESACSTGAGLAARERGQSVVGIENHTSFIRAARAGRIRVVATPLTRGRRSQLWQATARDEQGRLIATGRVRLLCLEAGTELAGEKLETK